MVLPDPDSQGHARRLSQEEAPQDDVGGLEILDPEAWLTGASTFGPARLNSQGHWFNAAPQGMGSLVCNIGEALGPLLRAQQTMGLTASSTWASFPELISRMGRWCNCSQAVWACAPGYETLKFYFPCSSGAFPSTVHRVRRPSPGVSGLGTSRRVVLPV